MHDEMIKENQMVIELRNPQNRGNFFTSKGTISFSRGPCIKQKIKSAKNLWNSYWLLTVIKRKRNEIFGTPCSRNLLKLWEKNPLLKGMFLISFEYYYSNISPHTRNLIFHVLYYKITSHRPRISFYVRQILQGCWEVLTPTRKEAS